MNHAIAIAARPITVLLLFSSSTVLANSNWEFNGQLRERITRLSAVEYNDESGEAGVFWTQRFTVESRYNIDDKWSINVGILNALQEGVDESPVERNNLDLHMAHIAYTTDSLQVKVGRQILKLGSQRLFGWRDGTNVRRAWQGVRATWKTDDFWTSDWFAMEFIGVNPNGIFNDDAQHENRVAGSYHTLDLNKLGWSFFDSAGLDLYYIYVNRDNKNTVEGRANQLRHSVGFRYFGDDQDWYWNWEGVYQTGVHGDLDIRAWTFAANTGFRFEGKYNPQIKISMNVASGDDNNNDGRLGTFDALFPRGDYFSGAAIVGPANFYNTHAYFMFNPTNKLSLMFDINAFWRMETEDGVYGPPGNLFQRPGASDSKDVNVAYSAALEWTMTDRLTSTLLLTYSRPREFLRASGADDDTLFIEYTMDWRLF